MPKGITEYKRRNAANRERYHRGRQWMQIFKQSQTEIKQIFREDLASGEITPSSRRRMEDEMFFERGFEVSRQNPYASTQGVIWEELNKGASVFTAKARFWMEKTLISEKSETEIDGAAEREAEPQSEPEEVEPAEKGFVSVSRSKVLQAVERVQGQEFSCRVQKLETGVYEVASFSSGEVYTVELNRGIFGVTAHCSCPDFIFTRLGRDELCKHVSSVYFFERQERVVSLNDAREAA